MPKSLALAAALISGLALPAGAEPLRIATEGAFPPFSSVTGTGEIVGFDVDIAKALCAEAGFQCSIVAQEWDGLIPGLIARKYDAIVASMTITDERRQVVDFTRPYYRSPTRLAARADSGFQATPDGMAGRIIGVQGGTVFETWVAAAFPDADIRAYPSVEEQNADLVAGRVEVVVGDAVQLHAGFLNTEAGQSYGFFGPEFTDPALVGDGIGIGLRQEDAAIRDRLNAAIEAIRADGTYARINAAYFDFDIYGE